MTNIGKLVFPDKNGIVQTLKSLSIAKGSPFIGNDKILRNIANGVSAANDVNVDIAEIIGSKILEKMNGQSIKDYVFRRTDQCVLMTAKGTTVNDKYSHIYPALLFQRLVTVARKSQKDESFYFKYE